MVGALKFACIWRNRALDQAALFHLVIASLALSMVIVSGIYLSIPPPLESGKATIMHLSPRTAGVRSLGRFGTRMVEMVAHDLPFTIFVPIEGAVDKLVRSCSRSGDEMESELRIGETGVVSEKSSSTNHEDRGASVSRCLAAVVSRIMSFSTVPKQIASSAVHKGREVELESLSGYKLYLAREPSRGIVVNNHTLVATDISRGLLVIHIIDGVLMDSMFEKSMDFEDD